MKPHNLLGMRVKAARVRIRATTQKYSGTPCKHGHDGTRYTSNGCCVLCSSSTFRRPKVATVNTALWHKLDDKICALQRRQAAVFACCSTFQGHVCKACGTTEKCTALGNCRECKKRANLRQKLRSPS